MKHNETSLTSLGPRIFTMLLEDLATELVLHIFRSCSSVQDVLNLASTCRRFRKICGASQKLPILAQAIDREYGPIDDAVQLVTHHGSQAVHLHRQAPLSIALFRQLLAVGRVASKWEDVYPVKKWKYNYEDRRLLNSAERYRLRRAIYRLWLYDRAFHNRSHPRFSRLHRPVVLERAALLHNWTTVELCELEDIRAVVRDIVENHICPSNGTIERKFRKRFPDPEHQLMFNIHLNYPAPAPFHPPFHPPTHHLHSHHHQQQQVTVANKYYTKYLPTAYHEPGAEGWGDEIPHYYVVEDMLKLDPGQIMWLRENAPLKGQVEVFIRGLGDWFENNGETFGQTLDWVLRERGSDLAELKEGIDSGAMGIACTGL